jgi:cytochrome c5
MGDHDDKVFLKRFSGIIAGLVIVTILIIIIATFRDEGPGQEDNPSRLAMAAERIAPVAGVRTELPAPKPVEAAPATAQEEPVLLAEANSGSDDPGSDIDGAAIYAQVCQACHMIGAAGAPVPGSDLWAERAEKGADALTVIAIDGIGIMPPKGGRMDLTDAEVRAAVDHMLAQ